MRIILIAVLAVLGADAVATAHSVDRVEFRLNRGQEAPSGHPRIDTLRIRLAQREYYFRSKGVTATGSDIRRVKTLSHLFDFVAHTGTRYCNPVTDSGDHRESWEYSLTYLSKTGDVVGTLSGSLPRPAAGSELRAPTQEGLLSLLSVAVELYDVARGRAAPQLAAAELRSAQRLPSRLFRSAGVPLVSRTSRRRVHHRRGPSSELVEGVQIDSTGLVSERWGKGRGIDYRLRPELLERLRLAVAHARGLPAEAGRPSGEEDTVYQLGGRRIKTLVRWGGSQEAALQAVDREMDEALGRVLQRARIKTAQYGELRLFGVRDHEANDPTQLAYDDMRVTVADVNVRRTLGELASMPKGASVLIEGYFRTPRFIVERIAEAPSRVKNLSVRVDGDQVVHDSDLGQATSVKSSWLPLLLERVPQGSLLSVDGWRTTSPSGDRIVVTSVDGRALNDTMTRQGGGQGPRLKRGDRVHVVNGWHHNGLTRYKLAHGDARISLVNAVHIAFDQVAETADASPARTARGLVRLVGDR